MNVLELVSDGELYAVDVTLVEKVVRNIAFTRVPAAPDAVAGIANFKGGVITILSLSSLLGRSVSEHAAHAVVFKSITNGCDQIGLLIDYPGELVSIDDDAITAPGLSGYGDKAEIISGYAEVEDKLLRIIDMSLL